MTKQYIDQELSNLAATNSYLRIRYEDFAKSNQQAIAEAVRFLGCDPGKIESLDKPRPRKQSKGSPADYISNWDELVDALSSKGLAGDLSVVRARS
jgi:hypothetical protein